MKNWLARRRGTATDVPHVASMCHLAPDNQWYSPVIAGATTLGRAASRGDAVRAALAVLERLTSDAYNQFVSDYYRAGLARFADDWHYADINTVGMTLARAIQPETYLEIGVRRGRSLAMVSSVAPDARLLAFDLWQQDYAGMDNPGPPFVEAELRRIGHRGAIEYVSGDSARTVPDFFAQHPGLFPEIITVDGDHSDAGARRDLANVKEHLPVGGALIFDDVSHPHHPGLLDVWRATVAADTRFATWEFTELGFGVAFALRIRA
jgi:predicted O-methyltransferase YrrM